MRRAASKAAAAAAARSLWAGPSASSSSLLLPPARSTLAVPEAAGGAAVATRGYALSRYRDQDRSGALMEFAWCAPLRKPLTGPSTSIRHSKAASATSQHREHARPGAPSRGLPRSSRSIEASTRDGYRGGCLPSEKHLLPLLHRHLCPHWPRRRRDQPRAAAGGEGRPSRTRPWCSHHPLAAKLGRLSAARDDEW